jgi:hypothetical protein
LPVDILYNRRHLRASVPRDFHRFSGYGAVRPRGLSVASNLMKREAAP